MICTGDWHGDGIGNCLFNCMKKIYKIICAYILIQSYILNILFSYLNPPLAEDFEYVSEGC